METMLGKRIVVAVLAGLLVLGNIADASEPVTDLNTQLTLLDTTTRKAQWRWVPDDAELIDINDLLQAAMERHPLVTDAHAKLAETVAKEGEVESRRLMYLFRYFDARHMENSAELDVEAARAQVTFAKEQALNAAIDYYADWVKATAASAAAFGQWQTTHAEKRYAQGQFNQGSLTGLELNQATANWLTAASKASQANQVRRQACLPMVALVDNDDLDEPCSVTGVTFLEDLANEPEWHASDLQTAQEGLAGLLPQQLPLADWLISVPGNPVNVALDKRQDLTALKIREQAVGRLAKASNLFELDQKKVLKATQARIKQARKQLELAIQAEVESSLIAFEASGRQLALAEAQRQLAARSWHQARVGVAAGYLSEREALATEAAYLAARGQVLANSAKLIQAKAKLLFSVGELQVQLPDMSD